MKITVFKSNFNAYTPYLESADEMAKSLFVDVYSTARNSVGEIIEKSKQAKSKDKEPLDCSNIIAFTGDRGAGKTSAMMSFSHALERNDYGYVNCAFERLPMIDPSHLNKDETIIDVVLSRLYTRFDKHCKDENYREFITLEKKREVYQSFQEVYKSIRTLSKNRKDRHEQPDSLESLRYIAAGNDLRNMIHNLLLTYFMAISPPGNNDGLSNFLVISVDDLDMNIEQGYVICEELRKYFNLPNVIVLFSVKMLQLGDIVQQEYIKWFRTFLDSGSQLSDPISDLATKYLDKLIPISRRCELPSFNIDNIGEVVLEYGDLDKERESQKYNPQRLLINEIFYLLFAKTGLMLMKNSINSHAFIPNSLRGIVHFVALIQSMKSITLVESKEIERIINSHKEKHMETVVHYLTKEEKRELQRNLDIVDKYIRQHSISEVSRTEASHRFREFLFGIIDESCQGLNQKICRRLCNLFNYKENSNKLIDDIISGTTVAENVSIGDVLYVLRIFSILSPFLDGERFFAILKIIYSLKILRLLFLGNIENDNSEKEFTINKNKLFGMLGCFIYVPGVDKVIRGNREWNPILSLNVKKEEDNDDSLSARRDWLLLHTIHYGMMDRQYYRKALTEPIYENVNSEIFTSNKGNTYRYFAENHLACITNCLRSIQNNTEFSNFVMDLSSDEFSTSYQIWQKHQISVIPLFSLDYLSEFVYSLLKNSNRGLRGRVENESAYYAEIVKSIKSVNESLLHNKTTLPEIDKRWFYECAGNFPFWTDTAIKNYSDIEYLKSKNEDIIADINRLISSVLVCTDKEQLINALRENFSLRGASNSIIKSLKPKQNRISDLRNKAEKNMGEEDFAELRDQAERILEEAISLLTSGGQDE